MAPSGLQRLGYRQSPTTPGGNVIKAKSDYTILDAVPANVAVLDAGGRIVAVNASWRRFVGDNGYRGDTCWDPRGRAQSTCKW